MGSCASNRASTAHKIDDIHVKPPWTLAVQVKQTYLKDKISPFSSGFRAINNNTVEVTGSGKRKVEGARWSRGFTSGKHVIEFIFPLHLRTANSRVGIAPERTSLGGNDLKKVVGGKGSWAVDLKASVLLENGKNIGAFPSQRKSLPDWFFMYIDLDTGTLQFGSDTEFFGTAFIGIRSDTPLFPMVTASGKGAIVGIVYRGKGKEIEGPLRKNRTLAAVRRSERAKHKIKIFEEQHKQNKNTTTLSSDRTQLSSTEPRCPRVVHNALYPNGVDPLVQVPKTKTLPAIRTNKAKENTRICETPQNESSDYCRKSSARSVRTPIFSTNTSARMENRAVSPVDVCTLQSVGKTRTMPILRNDRENQRRHIRHHRRHDAGSETPTRDSQLIETPRLYPESRSKLMLSDSVYNCESNKLHKTKVNNFFKTEVSNLRKREVNKLHKTEVSNVHEKEASNAHISFTSNTRLNTLV